MDQKDRALVSSRVLIATTGAACPMPSLLERLAAPDCPRCGSNWDRCGVHYVEPIETSR